MKIKWIYKRLKYDKYPINKALRNVCFLILTILLIVTFVCQTALTDGTLGDNIFLYSLAKLSWVFLFPSFLLIMLLPFSLEVFILILSVLGLIFNLSVYSILIERIITVFRHKKCENKRSNPKQPIHHQHTDKDFTNQEDGIH